MSEDWKLGDLAVCVDASRVPGNDSDHHRKLREGAVYEVEAITAPDCWKSGAYGIGLVLRGCYSDANIDGSYHADRFRKVRPDTQEPCEAEFITLLSRTKRRVGA